MTRTEFVRRLVLNSICDDFENIDQVILRDVSATGATCGMTIDRSEVVQALENLIQDGLTKAYTLPGPTDDPFSGELVGMPKVDEIEEDFKTYFYATAKGLELQCPDDAWWPLDDDGNLKPGWQL